MAEVRYRADVIHGQRAALRQVLARPPTRGDMQLLDIFYRACVDRGHRERPPCGSQHERRYQQQRHGFRRPTPDKHPHTGHADDRGQSYQLANISHVVGLQALWRDGSHRKGYDHQRERDDPCLSPAQRRTKHTAMPNGTAIAPNQN